jgi:hypothetical protein
VPSKRAAVEELIGETEAQLQVVKSKQAVMEAHAAALLTAKKEDTAIAKAQQLNSQLESLQASIHAYSAEAGTKDHKPGSNEELVAIEQAKAAKRYLKRLKSMSNEIGNAQGHFSTEALTRVAAAHALKEAKRETAVINAGRQANTKDAVKKLKHLHQLKAAALKAIDAGKLKLRANAMPKPAGCSQLPSAITASCELLGKESSMRCGQLNGVGAQKCCHAAIEEWRWGRAEYMELEAGRYSLASNDNGASNADAAAQQRQLQKSVEHNKALQERWHQSDAYRVSKIALHQCLGASQSTEAHTNPSEGEGGQLKESNEKQGGIYSDDGISSTYDPESATRSIAALSGVIDTSAESLHTDLQQLQNTATKEKQVSNQMQQMENIGVFVKTVTRQAAALFSKPQENGGAEQTELLSTSAEWERAEKQRKLKELEKSAGISAAAAIDVAKELLKVKWDPSPVVPMEELQEGEIPRGEEEADLSARLHAAYAAFLMVAHQWADILHGVIQGADTAATLAVTALQKGKEYQAELAGYKESDISKIANKAVSVDAQLSVATKEVNSVKTQAFKDGEHAKQANYRMQEKLKHMKHVVETASKPGPDLQERSKMERNNKLENMLKGLEGAAAGPATSDEAKLMLEKESVAAGVPT